MGAIVNPPGHITPTHTAYKTHYCLSNPYRALVFNIALGIMIPLTGFCNDRVASTLREITKLPPTESNHRILCFDFSPTFHRVERMHILYSDNVVRYSEITCVSH